MSWLTPKHLEDASRVLRGVALVLARAAADSNALRRVGAEESHLGLKAVADLLQAQVERAHLNLTRTQAGGGAAVSWAAERLSEALGNMDAASMQQLNGHASAAASSNPLVGYIFPETARMFATAQQEQRPAGIAAAVEAASQLQQLLQQQVSQTAQSLAGTPPEQLLGAAQQAVAQQAERLRAAAAAAASPATQSWGSPAAAVARQAAATAQARSQASGATTSAAAAPHASREAQQQQQQPLGHGAESVTTGSVKESTDVLSSINRSEGSHAAESISTPPASSAGPSSSSSAAITSGAAACAREVIGEWPSAHDDAGLVKAEELPFPPSAPAAAAAVPVAAPTTAATTSQAAPQQQQQPQPLGQPHAAAPARVGAEQEQQQARRPALRERRVPSTPIGRALGFAGMGASLLFGTLKDNIVNSFAGPRQAEAAQDGGSGIGGSRSGGSGGGAFHFITESNAERLAAALCRMRGAALKLGQMISIQDDTVLPPQIQSALERVRQGADVMPRAQLEGQLRSQLGKDWASKLEDFEWAPCAAASIGQVHSAVLKDGRRVAMKIQYPGVARSIESDVDNLMRLIAVANVLPRGLFVENAARVAKRELKIECDYEYEAAAQKKFKALVEADGQLRGGFFVPGVVDELCSGQVLASEWVEGYSIDKVRELDQAVRDDVGTRLLRLTLRELFRWRFMQTDPNWGNFLYDPATGVINLIDFGAAREYPKGFVDDYLRMVRACAERDREGVVDYSTRLGFLTGDESAVMLNAHSEAGFVVGLPFAAPEGWRPDASGGGGGGALPPYDFGAHAGMTARVSELGSVMLKHRLTAPPEESYSLHRKLSGAFLACMKLRARVPCRQLFYDAYDSHPWGPEEGRSGAGAGAAGGPEGGRADIAATA